MKSKASTYLVLFALLIAYATISLATKDPELKQCKDKCQTQTHFSQEEREKCAQRCEEYHREKQRRQHGGGDNFNVNPMIMDPQKEYEQCRVQCTRQPEGSRYSQEQCKSDCKEQLKQRQGQETEQERNNPYVFEDRHFITGIQTQHGRVRFLPKFTERSELFRGIENFRVSVLEADPQTFIVPSHWDADALFFVANGRGTVSLVRQEKRESFNIKQGDIMRIKAGTTSYLVNRDNKERLLLAKIVRPVNTPGQFEAFFGGGGDNPESFFNAFSDEILEAAFDTKRDRLQRLFGQQKQGVIIKASEEQIRALSRHEEGGIWPFGGESKGTFNLYKQRSTQSNQYGQLYEVDSSQFRQLRDLDIAVSLANITQGGMIAPHYNSKSTKISIVVDGEGYFEMACPHVSQGSQARRETRGSGPSYQKISSRLKRGTVLVIPAGHPYVAVASNNQNLQLLCFELNAFNNEKFLLAGKRNVVSQLEREAKELAFGMPAREVDEVFGRQQDEFFFKGPRQQQHHRGFSDE
ncbi:hypothetical protein ACJIZ3_011767 [Penstemon smallii]|uniref:Cupin type-1 domain-containing protein n=1 Tax=Penstemon smallii TaxID=265156 RepID=A0ABD3ULG1_9LAMI